jgi:tetratricopeptide (TPR) repeat protein
MGNIREGVRAYEKAVEISPDMKEAWLNMGQALKEEGRTVEAEKALLKVISLLLVALGQCRLLAMGVRYRLSFKPAESAPVKI